MGALAFKGIEEMGRRRNAASKQAVTLPKFGPNGELARAENARVQALIARDASDAEREARRVKHGYNDQPAAPRHYESPDMDKVAGERRYRALPADHPLVKAWVKRKIPETEFNAGNIYRIIYERAKDPAGRDSTTVLNRVTASGAGGVPSQLADAQACKDSLADLDARMGEIDRQLVEKFCGLALSLSAAVDSTVLCAPAGRLFRMREALRSLERAIQGGRLPEIAPELTQARTA